MPRSPIIHVEAVWVPFKDKAIPAWLHLPPTHAHTHSGGKLPVVISNPGMTATRKIQVALYGDKYLNPRPGGAGDRRAGPIRGADIGLPFTMENWMATGPALADWIAARPELDATRIGVAGTASARCSARC